MTTFKSKDPNLSEWAWQIKVANAQISKANKQVRNAKEAFLRWLKEKRSVDVSKLSIGDAILIDGILLLEIGKQNRLDEVAFAQAYPLLYKRFRKDIPVKEFRPLV